MSNQTAYDALFNEVCIGLGFCGSIVDGEPRGVWHRFPTEGHVTADDFVEWVFWAEGIELSDAAAIKFAPRLRDAFVRHLGSDVVDVKALR